MSDMKVEEAQGIIDRLNAVDSEDEGWLIIHDVCTREEWEDIPESGELDSGEEGFVHAGVTFRLMAPPPGAPNQDYQWVAQDDTGFIAAPYSLELLGSWYDPGNGPY